MLEPLQRVMRTAVVVLILLGALIPFTPSAAADNGIVIEEILVSASSAAYNGTDWNGDGEIGSNSDQYIQIRNTGTTDVDISDWILDDNIGEGSPPCRIGWNTTIAAGEAIVFYRANTGIELDYFDADSANLMDKEGNLISTMSYPGEDSWWDKVYTYAANGSLWKQDPNPSSDQGTCYTPRDHIHSGSYILQGRVVPMMGQMTL